MNKTDMNINTNHNYTLTEKPAFTQRNSIQNLATVVTGSNNNNHNVSKSPINFTKKS